MRTSSIPPLGHRATRRAMALVVGISLTPSLVWATDCEVNVVSAPMVYNPTRPVNFVTYPPPSNKIGCVLHTGVNPATVAILADFFGPFNSLKKCWSVKSYSVAPSSMTQNAPTPQNGYQISFAGWSKNANTTVNFRLTKLVLTKSGGSCANAINKLSEAHYVS